MSMESLNQSNEPKPSTPNTPDSSIVSRRSRGKSRKKAKVKLEARLLKEEELKKKKLDTIRSKLEAKVQEELQLSRVNGLKIQDEWRKLMRLAKAGELVNEIEILRQLHERHADRKDAVIERLERTLQEIEDQYQLALGSHMDNMDRLIALHDSRVDALESEFERDLKELEGEFNKEREEIMQKFEEEKEELLDIITAMEDEYNEAENARKQEFQNVRDDIKNKNAEEFGNLRMKLDNTIEKLEKEFNAANATYTTTTEAEIVKLRQYTYNDDQNTKTIEQNNRKLQRLQKNLNHWRTKMTNNMRECEQRNRALKDEKDAIAAHFQQLKGRMNKFREGQTAKLAELTKNTNNCMKELQRKLKQAEKILTLAEMNFKLETEKEKVLPFYKQSDEGEEPPKEEDPLNRFSTTVLTKKSEKVGEWNYLDNFYKRFNKVLLDKLALESEKQKLLNENHDLRAILKQYLDGISVSNDVLDNLNPLFVVNGRMADTIRVTEKTSGNDQTLEGTHVVVINQTTR